MSPKTVLISLVAILILGFVLKIAFKLALWAIGAAVVALALIALCVFGIRWQWRRGKG